MSLVIPDEVVKATHLSEAELRVELALFLYQQQRLTLGQAAKYLGVAQSTLRKWADEDLRSLNGQIEFLLRQALRERGRLGEEPAPPPAGDSTQ